MTTHYYTASRRVALADGGFRTVIEAGTTAREFTTGQPVASLIPSGWPLQGVPREWVIREWLAGAFNLTGDEARDACDEAREASRTARYVQIYNEARAAYRDDATTRTIACEILARAALDALDFGTELRAGYVQSSFEARQSEFMRMIRSEKSEPKARRTARMHAVRDALARLGFEF